MALPLRVMTCDTYGLAAFPELSVVMSEPLTLPSLSGAKLTASEQRAPGPNGMANTGPSSCGQVLEPPRTKLAERLGLLPVVGPGKTRFMLPRLVSVTIWALLTAPTVVCAKLRDGGVVRSMASTRLLPESAMKTLPDESSATALG